MKRVGLVVLGLLFACGDSSSSSSSSSGTPSNATPSFESGVELRVAVPESGRVYAKLDPPAVVGATDAWDLAFEGFDIFTNGGESGHGQGSAFGPLDAITFIADEAPAVPFMTTDKAGGAFLDWYAYDGTTHALYSRLHVFGVRDGQKTWKVQILGYYGDRDGADVAALYHVRWAEVGTSDLHELSGIDGTAGGTTAPPTATSECLDLGSGTRTMLTPEAASTSSAWHLCFRRASISVNGERGGPRGVGAVDAEADAVATETLAAVMKKTPDSEKAVFDAATFDGLAFRGDRIVTAFSEKWLDRDGKPANGAWLVVDASGQKKIMVGFTAVEGATAKSPGTVVLRAKPVKG